MLPGSGRSLLPEAAGLDVLITGDLSYHDAERAEELALLSSTRRTGDSNGGACAAGRNAPRRIGGK